MVPTPAALVRRFFAGLVLLVSSASAYNGQGTAYGTAGGRGAGACEIHGNLGRFETFYAAMNHAQFRGTCGNCVNVCGAAGCAVLMVVDLCPSCGHGDIDMSTNALKEVTGYSWDRKPISWSWTSCGGSSAIRSKSGSKCNCRRPKDSNCKKKCRRNRGL